MRFIKGGKRLGIAHSDSLEDWFTSFSPRNDNCNAEGQWGQWAHMAAQILAHPLTRIAAPELYRPELPWRHDLYDETPNEVTKEQIVAAELEHRRNIQALALGLPLDATEEGRKRALDARYPKTTEGGAS